MEPTELSKMRLKQVAVTNTLILMVMIIFYLIISVFTIQFAHFFFVLGVLMLFQGVFGLIKGDSPKSIIPIFEQVAIYEKQKMGDEWFKQRKVSYVWNLILSCFLFLQSYWNRDSTDHIFQMEYVFMFITIFALLVVVNIGLIIHFRKVDYSTSQTDMEGYTWKSNLIGVAFGIVFAMVMIAITLVYIFL